jgi:hypothetical protein
MEHTLDDLPSRFVTYKWRVSAPDISFLTEYHFSTLPAKSSMRLVVFRRSRAMVRAFQCSNYFLVFLAAPVYKSPLIRAFQFMICFDCFSIPRSARTRISSFASTGCPNSCEIQDPADARELRGSLVYAHLVCAALKPSVAPKSSIPPSRAWSQVVHSPPLRNA